jgi:hypothetical protein
VVIDHVSKVFVGLSEGRVTIKKAMLCQVVAIIM